MDNFDKEQIDVMKEQMKVMVPLMMELMLPVAEEMIKRIIEMKVVQQEQLTQLAATVSSGLSSVGQPDKIARVSIAIAKEILSQSKQ